MEEIVDTFNNKIRDFIDFLGAQDNHEAFAIICAIIGAIAAAIIYGINADEVKLGTIILMLPLGAIIGAIVSQIIIFLAYVVVWGFVLILFLTVIYWILWAIFNVIAFLYNIVLWEN